MIFKTTNVYTDINTTFILISRSKPLPNMIQHPTIKGIAKKHNKTTGQVLLRFLIEKNIVPIPKSVTPKRIIENFNVFDFTLDADDLQTIEALDVGEAARICDFDFFPP